MSLSAHLDDASSPIGAFLRARFAHTASLTREANERLRAAPCSAPPLLPGAPYPYGTIGAAVDYRIRYAFGLTPARQTVAYLGAQELAYALAVAPDGSPAVRANSATVLRLLDAFFDAADAQVARMHPAGRALPVEAERHMARICFALARCEEAFRAPDPPASLSALIRTWLGRHDLPIRAAGEGLTHDLLALPSPACVEDLCRLAARFVESQQPLLGRPAILNPTFAGSHAIGGADADLIVDGCLIDIKSGRRPVIAPRDLRQLAGYLLLDSDDALRIHSAGIYKARYGVLARWPVAELLARLTDDPAATLSGLRAEFRQLCARHDSPPPNPCGARS